jgi:methionyl-tRNA formyltransferase
MNDIIILISNDMYSSRVFKPIIEKYPEIISAIVDCKSVGGNIIKRIKRKIKIAKGAGFHFALYKFLETTGYQILSILKGKPTFYKLAKKNNIKYIKTNDVSSDDFIKNIKKLQPKIIFSTTTQIFKKRFFEHVSTPVLNGHGSLLPKYRGATQYVWYLLNKDTNAGVTIHIMEQGIDTGNILMQKEFFIEENDSAYKIHYKIANELSKLYADVCELKLEDLKFTKQNEENISYCQIPSKNDIKLLRKEHKLIPLKDFFKLV